MRDMNISLIVAMTREQVIGSHNQLPWYLPADLRHFKQLTLKHVIVMGRKTYDSIGKPLPDRRNLIITRQQGWQVPGCEVFHSITDMLSAIKGEQEVWVIGGAELFTQLLPLAKRMMITWVEANIAGDIYFPHWDSSEWQCVSEEKHSADEKNPYAYTFTEWIRERG